MAPVKPAPQSPLDQLENQVGSVLFQLGKVFKHAHQADRKGLEQAKAKAAKGIPSAQVAFDEAVDELERELTKARHVISRDLQQLQEKRAAREKAAGAARLQAANGASANGQALKKEPGAADSSENGASGDPSAVDQIMSDTAAVLPNELDQLFSNSGEDFGALGTANTTSQQTGGGADPFDDLFGDGMDFGREFGMGSETAGDGMTNFLPGMEKYANQGQDQTANANGNGQNAAAGAIEDDLDAILSGIDGNGDPQPTTGSAAAGQANSGGNGQSGGSGNGQSADNSEKKKNESAPQASIIDADAMDLGTFDFGADDGNGVMPGDEGINDWFNFD